MVMTSSGIRLTQIFAYLHLKKVSIKKWWAYWSQVKVDEMKPNIEDIIFFILAFLLILYSKLETSPLFSLTQFLT